MGAGDLFPGFARRNIDTDGGRIFARVGGAGPPLLLLHTFLQSHHAWHRIAPSLAERFTVVAADVRGYGASACPPSDCDHRPYSKRVMAREMRTTMSSLGFDRFDVIGHGRGGLIAHRLGIEHGEVIGRMVVLDVVPTLDQWRIMNASVDHRMSHWPLLAQPAPVPETLIGRDPAGWLQSRLERAVGERGVGVFDPRALSVYRDALADPDRVHAMCEDHRAGARCDVFDDEQDLTNGIKLRCPLLVVWGSNGNLSGVASRSPCWQRWCPTVVETVVEGGHYLPEENPVELLGAMKALL